MSKTITRAEFTGAICANCGRVFTLKKEDKNPYPASNYCWRGCQAQHAYDLDQAEKRILQEKLVPTEY